jgi:hypothetical protein
MKKKTIGIKRNGVLKFYPVKHIIYLKGHGGNLPLPP